MRFVSDFWGIPHRRNNVENIWNWELVDWNTKFYFIFYLMKVWEYLIGDLPEDIWSGLKGVIAQMSQMVIERSVEWELG